MNRLPWTVERTLLGLALLTALCLVFNMAAMPLHAEEVFLRRDTISAVEIIMLVGFGLVFIIGDEDSLLHRKTVFAVYG